ncbi:3-beta hydroxysteroid dehydrogenase [Devosia soli]|uniref:3-beta hydroxysteroid dehydrogenase n=1 Tax=Devosia soli TaxID=361041 RepID=A0A0F5LAB6_9HYPH|nr:SDR family oxidoreductase [Devosia soli]KKB79288.1 3-beta hydroxysteroid dehydrogenase [Devosia soli]
MRIFVTGGSGFVGSAVVRHLLAAGHTVTGLARSDKSAAALEAAGARVQRGDLADTDILAAAAASADAAMHLGYIHDFSQMTLAANTDRAAISAIGQALAGSDRPLLFTSGLAGLAPGRAGTEDDASIHAAGNGRDSEKTASAFADQGVRVGIVRLAPSVHGDGDHGFVPTLIDIARRKGLSAYVDNGDNLWSAIHVEDAANVYMEALHAVAPGITRFHAAADRGIPFRDIATIIGQRLGVPVKSIPAAQSAEHFGWMGMFAQLGMSASSTKTQKRLGWTPSGPGLIEDLETGTYFEPGQRGLS